MDLLNKLMVVAHPDDEILFGGYYLIKYKGWDVVCLTNKDNKVRYNEFKLVMEKLDINFFIFDYIDEKSEYFIYKGLNISESEIKLKNDILKIINSKSYDILVTHNPCGEYGHPQHIYLSNFIYSLIDKKDIIYYFDITDTGSNILKKNGISQQIYNPFKKREIFFNLDDNIIDYKKELLKIYMSQQEVFQRPKINPYLENSIITNSQSLEHIF